MSSEPAAEQFSFDQPQAELAHALSESGIPESKFIVLHEGETRIF